MLVEGLDHVQVAAPAGCETAARQFYGELLGLPEVPKPAGLSDRGGAWFAVGSQQVHVGVTKPFAPARQAHPALRVSPEALDRLAGRLEAAGRPVRWDHEIEDVRRFFTSDPWGNRIELLSKTGGEGASPAEARPPGA